MVRGSLGLAILMIAELILIALLLCVCSVSARTITVDDDGEADHSGIQDAINVSSEGDSIRVFAGTYHENVLVNRSLTLIGNGTEDTIIMGGPNKSVVNISADHVNISGFTVLGNESLIGNGTIWYYEGAGIKVKGNHIWISDISCLQAVLGIYLEDSDNCTIINTTCRDNIGGISITGSRHIDIINSTCNENDYGIYLSKSNRIDLTNINCSANSRPGIALYETNDTSITNISSSYNGDQGILVLSSENTFIDNMSCNFNDDTGITMIISDNISISGGSCQNNKLSGISCANGYDITIEDIQMIGNQIGIEIESSNTIRIESVICSYNSIDGIRLENSFHSSIVDCWCLNNLWQGITFLYSNDSTVSGTLCLNNELAGISSRYSGHISVKDTICSNNDIGFQMIDSSWITISDSRFTDNPYFGIEVMPYSHNNTITNNMIAGNLIGIRVEHNTTNNIAHYNHFSNNLYCGINSTVPFDAILNWWGHDSGPYHPITNPLGEGENISINVIFDPWLDDNGTLVYRPIDDMENEGDDSRIILLYLMLGVLVSLFILLIIIVRLPDTCFSKGKSGKLEKMGTTPEPEEKRSNWDSFKPPEEWGVRDGSDEKRESGLIEEKVVKEGEEEKRGGEGDKENQGEEGDKENQGEEGDKEKRGEEGDGGEE